MAFVHDIEADKIDSDFNLLTSFVKIPLVILGSVLGGRRVSTLQDDDDDDMVDAAVARSPNFQCRNDDGDAMDCTSLSTSLEAIEANQRQSSPSNRIVSDSDIDETDTEGLKRSKRMSWSDSVGLRLVEYDDECLPREPRVCRQKLTKSAMKQKDHLDRDPAASSTFPSSKRYIPKMGGAGITMPSFSSSHGTIPPLSSGNLSPEWGWYVNTTPPTPDMYQNNSSFSSSSLTRSDTTGAPTFPYASSIVSQTTSKSIATRGKSHKNTVFQNLQSSVTPNMGWTSVPI